MVEHSDLVAEMSMLEKMPMQERLKHARKRRSQQLKKYSHREKEFSSKKKKNSVVKQKPQVTQVQFDPSVVLLESASRNDVEEVRRLLTKGVSPDVTNDDGLTALHQCCIDDSEEMMQLLLEFNANVNATDSELWTPLHAAATCGHLHLVKLLINKGADLLAVNADGNMAYDICEDEITLDFIESVMAGRGVTQELIDETRSATEHQMYKDTKILIETGQSLEYRNDAGATPLHVASANGYITVVELLLDNHASLDAQDDDGWQPIHAAACWGHAHILEMLVSNGADIEANTHNDETPFDICEDPDLRDRIIELKSEIEYNLSRRPLHMRRQSTNTRSQSIRRTSIRDKTALSRREAQEEARVRALQNETKETVNIADVDIAVPSSPSMVKKAHKDLHNMQKRVSPRQSPKLNSKKPDAHPAKGNGDGVIPTAMERLDLAIKTAPSNTASHKDRKSGDASGDLESPLEADTNGENVKDASSDSKNNRRTSNGLRILDTNVFRRASREKEKSGDHVYTETKYKFSSVEVVGEESKQKCCCVIQ